MPEDSRVLRERSLVFPTFGRLDTWLIPLERSGLDDISRVNYGLTQLALVPLLLVLCLVFSNKKS